MKDGDKWICPNCGDSFFVKKAVYDGFTKTGEVLKCAFCGAVAQHLTENGGETENAPENKKKVAADFFGEPATSEAKHDTLDDLFGGKVEKIAKPNLDDLFGGKVEKIAKPNLDDLFGGETERRFCRDCEYRAINAFAVFCSKHNKNVEPLDSCPDFKRLKHQNKE